MKILPFNHSAQQDAEIARLKNALEKMNDIILPPEAAEHINQILNGD